MRRGGNGGNHCRAAGGLDQAAPVYGQDGRGDAVEVLRVRQRVDRRIDANAGERDSVGQTAGIALAAAEAVFVALAAVVRDGDGGSVSARRGGVVASDERDALSGGQAGGQGGQVLQCEEGVAIDADAVHAQGAAADVHYCETLIVLGVDQHGSEILAGGTDAEDGIRPQGCHMEGGLGELAGDCAHRSWIGGVVGGAVGIDVAGAVAAHGLALEEIRGTVIGGVHGPVEHDHQITAGVVEQTLQRDGDRVLTGRICHSAVEDLG